MTFCGHWKKWVDGGEDWGSSTNRLKADIQSLGRNTAPHSWPGSLPLTSEVDPQSGISLKEGLHFHSTQPCVAIHHAHLGLNSFIHTFPQLQLR